MILDTNKIVDYEVESGGEDFEGGEVSIDTSNMGLFYEMMSKSIYSDPIGSIGRELVSNGFDAHAEANILGLNPDNIRHPVIIKGFYEELDYYISFQDFGVGMSEERFKDVYLKYLSSSKRQSNEYMGAFGLGSKSPFSYADVFYVLTRYNGVEYYYVMSKGQNAKPNWDLLYKKDTTEPNGTTVKFQIEGGKYGKDWEKFGTAIRSQLRYFDDVYVTDFGVDNDYRILEYKTFKFRKDTQEQEMHIALGKVTYPINWKELKRQQLNIPVGVKFEIGELVITPNREAIRYNDTTIEIINNRIDACLAELKSLIPTSTYDTLEGTLKAKKESHEKFIRLEEDTKLTIYPGNYGVDKNGEYIRYLFDIPEPQFKLFENTPIKIPSDPFFGFRTVGFIGPDGYKSVKSEDNSYAYTKQFPVGYANVYNTMKQIAAFRTNDFKINKLKIAYIGTLPIVEKRWSAVIVAKDNSVKLKAYMSRIGLSFTGKRGDATYRDDKGKRINRSDLIVDIPYIQDGMNKTKLVMLYKKVITNELIKLTESYDRLKVPEKFEEDYKAIMKAKRSTPNSEEIMCFSFNQNNLMHGGFPKSPRNTSTFNSCTLVYGSNKDENLLVAVYKIMQKRKNLFSNKAKYSLTKVTDSLGITKTVKNVSNIYIPFEIIMMNNVDLKKMKGENKIYVDSFIKHRAFLEQATAYYIYDRYSRLRISWVLNYIPAVKEWYSKLHDFMKRTVDSDSYASNTISNKFVQQMLELLIKENLLLKEYIDIVDVLELIDEDLSGVEILSRTANNYYRRRDIASFLVSKKYIVDPVYLIKFTDHELDWINAHLTYTGYTARDYDISYEKSVLELAREVYQARNNKFSLYTGYTWHTNFPKFGTSKSVKISMLSLAMSQQPLKVTK